MKTNRKDIIREIARLRAEGLSWLEVADRVKDYWPGKDRQRVAWCAQSLFNSKAARKLREDESFLQVAGYSILTKMDAAGNIVSCVTKPLYADEI